MLIPARAGEQARLASWPRPYPQNPYLQCLADALAGEHVTTMARRYLAHTVAAPSRARWLHLHWPEWMMRDRSRGRMHARAAWFFGLLDAARARGMSIAWTAHNLVGHDEVHADLALQTRRELLRRCQVVFGHFASARGDLEKLGFSGRFVHTPHPGFGDTVPAAVGRSDARRALGYTGEQQVLLCFGAIETYKGFDRIASAFIDHAPSSARLHIAGSVGSRQALTDLGVAACDDPRIRIDARFAPPERVALLFSAADALVLGYRAFYTSGTAMLALTYGTPIIGAPEHHLADFVGEPFFVPCTEPAKLGLAIQQLNDRVIDEETRSRARAYAGARTWAGMAHSVADALFPGRGV